MMTYQLQSFDTRTSEHSCVDFTCRLPTAEILIARFKHYEPDATITCKAWHESDRGYAFVVELVTTGYFGTYEVIGFIYKR